MLLIWAEILSRQIAKHPGLSAILVPDSNTMLFQDRTRICCGIEKLLIWAQRYWSRRIAKHPGLTAILVPDSNTMKNRRPLWHNN